MSTHLIMKMMLLIILLLSMVAMAYADNTSPTPVGKVVWIKGDSFKATMPNKEERLLQKQSVIYLHDILITNANTTAEVVFTDNTLITFQPGTTFSVDEYDYHPKKEKNSVGKSVMKLIEGGFRTITGLIAKNNPDDYEVKAPVGTIGVRGTDYAIYIENGELFIKYYSGTPCVSNQKGTLCLDQQHPYAQVTNINTIPQSIATQPSGFTQTLDVTNATIGPFTGPGSGGGTGGNLNGPISSFCIQ